MAVEETIYDFLVECFGTGKVIWKEQAGPRPSRTYASMHVLSDIEIGLAESQQVADIGGQTINEQVQLLMRMILQLEVYSEAADDLATLEAMELLEGCLLQLQASQTVRRFRESNVAFMFHERPLRLDEFTGEHWERRALCDLTFTHVVTPPTPESVGQIDTAVPTINLS